MSDETQPGAVFSPCDRYRYVLRRQSLLNQGTVLFVMLNPSTATATEDDPTIRRCIRFVRAWGYGELVVANLYALRTPHPRQLHEADDPVGPDNDGWLASLANDSELTIVAWGADPGPDPERPKRVLKTLAAGAGEIMALGTCADGSPRHPLYVKGYGEPTTYPPEEA